MAERTGLAVAELGIHRFAIVLDEIHAALVGKAPHHIERCRVAEDADAYDRSGARPHGGFELAHIHVDGIELDVDDFQL